ncbi:unnamed protein product [Ectocarpus sp. 12 AP-2014]
MKCAAALVVGGAVCAQAFLPASLPCHLTSSKASAVRASRTSVRMSAAAELPTQAQRQRALYDMVYVERLPEEQQMTSGLFLPAKANPRMHVCKVVSVGNGREGESGHVTPNDAVKPGDLVFVKDPYGIGPRDDEFAGKKFSFVRFTSICAIIPNSEDFENAAREAGKLQAEIDKAAGSGLVF